MEKFTGGTEGRGCMAEKRAEEDPEKSKRDSSNNILGARKVEEVPSKLGEIRQLPLLSADQGGETVNTAKVRGL